MWFWKEAHTLVDLIAISNMNRRKYKQVNNHGLIGPLPSRVCWLVLGENSTYVKTELLLSPLLIPRSSRPHPQARRASHFQH